MSWPRRCNPVRMGELIAGAVSRADSQINRRRGQPRRRANLMSTGPRGWRLVSVRLAAYESGRDVGAQHARARTDGRVSRIVVAGAGA